LNTVVAFTRRTYAYGDERATNPVISPRVTRAMMAGSLPFLANVEQKGLLCIVLFHGANRRERCNSAGRLSSCWQDDLTSCSVPLAHRGLPVLPALEVAMTFSLPLLLLVLLTLVMLVLGAIRGEFKSSVYWFQALVALAILFTFGLRTA
jgi:hypothetical protein